jgi:hypothetical protein
MPPVSEQLTIITDPGHAWVRVPLVEIAQLGIEDQISAYSFINGRFAYHSASS